MADIKPIAFEMIDKLEQMTGESWYFELKGVDIIFTKGERPVRKSKFVEEKKGST